MIRAPNEPFGLAIRLAVAGALSLLLLSPTVDAKGALSDSQIRQLLIQQSIASYPGNCPCPYNAARNGSSCGRRSAYSRARGYQPLCYSRDISQRMVDDYRQHNGIPNK